jgi:D-alanine--poly(phosphoribitol) ligase subunit 1
LSDIFSHTNPCLLTDVFHQNVLRFPLHQAIVINGKNYSYQEVWNLAAVICQNIPTDKTYNRIGIYCNDDIYTYASIIAVNMYGAAYVPLNNTFPNDRIKMQIELCQLEIILSSDINSDKIKEISRDKILIDTDDLTPESSEEILPVNHYRKTTQPVCYILFTSGTTGIAKGVPVSHENVFYFFEYFLNHYDFNEKDRFLQVYELSFDVSVFSFFMPLLTGGCCYVLPSQGIKYLKIMEYLVKYDITVLSMVPSVLKYIEHYLPEIELPELRYSFFSGDALLHHLAVKWSKVLAHGVIHNFYGPTETTIVCSRYIFEEQQSEKESVNNIVPIGKLFDGLEFLIMNNNTPSDKGELCIAGKQVISGYLNNEYEDRFIIHNGKKYYKTGDIVSVNEFNNLVFYGREDSQVKINGYRIELAEIENVIFKTTGLSNVVLCNTNSNNINELVVYIEAETVDKNAILQKLQTSLPAYMLPQHFVAANNFPLNNNGKIDKNKLREIK